MFYDHTNNLEVTIGFTIFNTCINVRYKTGNFD